MKRLTIAALSSIFLLSTANTGPGSSPNIRYETLYFSQPGGNMAYHTGHFIQYCDDTVDFVGTFDIHSENYSYAC